MAGCEWPAHASPLHVCTCFCSPVLLHASPQRAQAERDSAWSLLLCCTAMPMCACELHVARVLARTLAMSGAIACGFWWYELGLRWNYLHD